MADELVRLLQGLMRARARRPRPSSARDHGSQVSRSFDPPGDKPFGVAQDKPTSPFEPFFEARLQALERELAEVRNRVNGLLFLVVGAVLVQLLLRLMS